MARKGENIYKRKDGRWEGRCIVGYDKNGKAKYKYVYAKTYKAVKDMRLSILSQKKTESLKQCTLKTQQKFENTLDDWLACKKISVKESTYIRYKNSIENHIKPHLGDYDITQIDTTAIEEFAFKLFANGKINAMGGLSAKTITDILIIIKEVLSFARVHGFVIMCNFDNIQIKRNNCEMRVLSSSETQQLITVLINNINRDKLGVLFCLFTGIRIGELCALQWKNISFTEQTVKIDKTMQRLQMSELNDDKKTHIVITDPKSYSSIRTIPLPDFMMELLKRFQGSDDEYLLTGEIERFIEPRTMQNHFKLYLKEAGIDNANFHSLRHTFATRCVELGFDIKTLSEILGHSSVKITLDKYVHSSIEQKRINMNKLKLQ